MRRSAHVEVSESDGDLEEDGNDMEAPLAFAKAMNRIEEEGHAGANSRKGVAALVTPPSSRNRIARRDDGFGAVIERRDVRDVNSRSNHILSAGYSHKWGLDQESGNAVKDSNDLEGTGPYIVWLINAFRSDMFKKVDSVKISFTMELRAVEKKLFN